MKSTSIQVNSEDMLNNLEDMWYIERGSILNGLGFQKPSPLFDFPAFQTKKKKKHRNFLSLRRPVILVQTGYPITPWMGVGCCLSP